jgi:hypothetical protein
MYAEQRNEAATFVRIISVLFGRVRSAPVQAPAICLLCAFK